MNRHDTISALWNRSGWMFLLAGLFMGGQTTLHAQQKETPSPPYLAAAPDSSAWTITATYRQVEKPTNPTQAAEMALRPLLKEENITKSGETAHVTRTWANGRTTEGWSQDGIRLMNPPQLAPDKIAIENLHARETTDKAATPGQFDFPEVKWVNATNYKDTVSYLGRKCFLYEDKIIWQTDVRTLTHAWIDVETHLPVALDDGHVAWVYAIRPIPPVALALPPTYTTQLNTYRRGLGR